MAEQQKSLPRLSMPPRPGYDGDEQSATPRRDSVAGIVLEETIVSAAPSDTSSGKPLLAEFPTSVKQQHTISQDGVQQTNNGSPDHRKIVLLPQSDQAQGAVQANQDSLSLGGTTTLAKEHSVTAIADHDTIVVSRPAVTTVGKVHSIPVHGGSQQAQSQISPPQLFSSVAPVQQPQPSTMLPPTAPASMLASIMPSGRAKAPKEWLTDESIWGRLIPAAVILFRMGKAKESRAVAQFAVDLVGKGLWDRHLPTYQEAAAEPDDEQAVDGLLQQAVAIIRYYDLESAGFLAGMLS